MYKVLVTTLYENVNRGVALSTVVIEFDSETTANAVVTQLNDTPSFEYCHREAVRIT